jgi:hypothetical protein
MSQTIEQRFPEDQPLSCAYMNMLDHIRTMSPEEPFVVEPENCVAACALRLYVTGLFPQAKPTRGRHHIVAASSNTNTGYELASTLCPRTR